MFLEQPHKLILERTLAAMRGQLLVMRARANHEFLSLMSDREAANAGHFESTASPPSGI